MIEWKKKTVKLGHISSTPWFQTHCITSDKTFSHSYFIWEWWLYNLQYWVINIYVILSFTRHCLKFFLGLQWVLDNWYEKTLIITFIHSLAGTYDCHLIPHHQIWVWLGLIRIDAEESIYRKSVFQVVVYTNSHIQISNIINGMIKLFSHVNSMMCSRT